jgi:hypothetical protein
MGQAGQPASLTREAVTEVLEELARLRRLLDQATKRLRITLSSLEDG